MCAEFAVMMWNLFRIGATQSQLEINAMDVKLAVTRTRKQAENEQKKSNKRPDGILTPKLSAVDPEYVRTRYVERGFSAKDVVEDLQCNLGVIITKRNKS